MNVSRLLSLPFGQTPHEFPNDVAALIVYWLFVIKTYNPLARKCDGLFVGLSQSLVLAYPH